MIREVRQAVNTISDEVRYATFVRADRERVFDGIATAEGLNGWFTDSALIEPRAGGVIRLQWEDWGPDHYAGEDSGSVIEALCPERFVFQWHPENDNPSYTTTVEINFEEAGGGTIIRLKESGFQDTPAGRRKLLENASGWGEALTLWKFYVEHGISY